VTWGGIIAVALGGASGAVLRLLVSAAIGAHHLFPWATLAINIAGSFAIGLLWGGYAQTEWFQQWGRMLLVVGLLGGFTTFSAFSLETMNLLQSGRIASGFSYVLASMLGCLLSVFLGERLGQMLVP
jgi:fluoride exporter